MSRQWDALDARVLAAVDRRPVRWWLAAAAFTGVLLAPPGTFVGWYLDGVLTTDAAGAAGAAGAPMIVALGVPVVCVLGLIVVLGAILANLPRQWFGLSPIRSRVVTAALVGWALLPWTIPGGPLLSRAGESRGWALAFALAGCLALPTAALLVPADRRLRAIGALCLLVTGSLWLTARQERLATETAVALRSFGSPPRDLVRVLRWNGAAATALSTGTGHDQVTVEYDEIMPLPVPDGSELGVLTIVPLPGGWDAAPDSADSAACAAGRSAALRVASDTSGAPGAPAPVDPTAPVDESSACRSVGAQEWQVGSRTVVLRSGSVLLTLVATGEASPDASPDTLRAVIRTQHVADDAEVRRLSLG